MAIPTSGQFSFGDIRNEFGGSNPVYLNQYYRGGARVPSNGTTGNIPTSGVFYLNTFRGASGSSPLNASASNIYASNLPNGSTSRSTTVVATGGTGNYSLTAASLASGGPATISRNGMQITVTASATNAERNGTVNFTVSDGATSVTRSFQFYMQFGVPI